MNSRVNQYPHDGVNSNQYQWGHIEVHPKTSAEDTNRAVALLNGAYAPTIQEMYDRIRDLVESGNAADLEPLLEVWPFDLDLTVAERLEDISQPLMARLESPPTQKATTIFNNCTFYGYELEGESNAD